MADDKETEIVFEYPDDDEISGNKLPDEKEVEQKEAEPKNETQVEAKQEDFDLEIEDDTPAQDRGREPLPKEVVEELEKDTLDDYSERVKQRLAQMKKVWHDERRAKEAADREKDEAIRYAQQVAQENKKLKSTLSSGEEEYIKAINISLDQQLKMAQRDYREAYDSGDTDKIIDAQTRMNDAQLRLSQVQNYTPQYQKALQEAKLAGKEYLVW